MKLLNPDYAFVRQSVSIDKPFPRIPQHSIPKSILFTTYSWTNNISCGFYYLYGIYSRVWKKLCKNCSQKIPISTDGLYLMLTGCLPVRFPRQLSLHFQQQFKSFIWLARMTKTDYRFLHLKESSKRLIPYLNVLTISTIPATGKQSGQTRSTLPKNSESYAFPQS